MTLPRAPYDVRICDTCADTSCNGDQSMCDGPHEPDPNAPTYAELVDYLGAEHEGKPVEWLRERVAGDEEFAEEWLPARRGEAHRG